MACWIKNHATIIAHFVLVAYNIDPMEKGMSKLFLSYTKLFLVHKI